MAEIKMKNFVIDVGGKTYKMIGSRLEDICNELEISEDRFIELLSRDAYCPTLSAAPTSSTLTYIDTDGSTNHFHVGQLCRWAEGRDYRIAVCKNITETSSSWYTLPTKVSELENDNDYATTSSMNTELAKKVDKVDGKQLSTEDFTIILKQKLDGLSNYDDTEIQTAVSNLRTDLDTLVSGDTTTAIKTFNEVIAFLDGISDSEDLDSIIAGIERQIGAKQDTITDLETIRSGAAKGATALQSHQDISGKLDVTTAASTYLSKTDAASTYLGKTAKASSAASADSATKATQDANGNVITATYATKTEVSNAESIANEANDKADSSELLANNALNSAREAKTVANEAKVIANTAKNAVATLEGLANTTTAQETLAAQVVQIETNKTVNEEQYARIAELKSSVGNRVVLSIEDNNTYIQFEGKEGEVYLFKNNTPARYVFFRTAIDKIDDQLRITLSNGDNAVTLDKDYKYIFVYQNPATPQNYDFTYINTNSTVYGMQEEIEGAYDKIEESIKGIQKDINDIKESAFYIEKGSEIEYNEVIEGKYITHNGDLLSISNTSFKVYLYPVTPGEEYYVYSTLRLGASRAYAIYSSETPSKDTAITVGPVVTEEREDLILVKAPEGSAYLGITRFGDSKYGLFNAKKQSVQDLGKEVSVIANGNKKADVGLLVKLSENGEDLYISYLDRDSIEYVYWFKKCMFNNLYTFYRVGYRVVTRNYPSVEGIDLLKDVVLINVTGSDNIGPMSFENGGWAGGNHSYNNDSITKTAYCKSFDIFADGYKLNPGDIYTASKIQIKVINTIYDPSIAPNDGSDTLSVPISTECVEYVIVKNNIEVSVKQKFVENTSNRLSVYYGMQSMFDSESHFMTPRGQYTNWQSSVDTSLKKEDYPIFNRFIESNLDRQTYQATYLMPNKDGNHDKTTINVFSRSYGKTYHTIVNNISPIDIVGRQLVWSGVYTFFARPIIDNDYVFAYSGTVNGKDAIFINTKQAFVGNIDMPSQYYMRKIEMVEKDDIIDTANIFVDAGGVEIESSGTGSMILLVI